jgi:dipeptidyl aminopeptidase/acylaminoacyl peptidase
MLTRVVIVLVVAGLIAVLGLCYKTARIEYAALSPPRRPVERPQLGAELATLRDVAFETGDGLELKGWYIPSKNRAAVILVHGYGANRAEMLPEARILARNGYGVLLYDSRAHGESEGQRLGYGERERQDLRAAVGFLEGQPDVDGKRLGALGFSVGANAVAFFAAEDARLRAVVLEATTTSLRAACQDEYGRLAWLKLWPAILAIRHGGVDTAVLDTAAAAAKISPRPVLIVHGDQDPVARLARGQQLFAATREPKRMFVVRGAKHGGYTEVDPAGYEQALLGLFGPALTAP